MQSALTILQSTFGYENFRLNQQAIIESAIQGKDVMALMPTGGGKSLCYQIPALVREGTGIVISPLIALMQDQVEALKLLGIRAAYLNSTLSFAELKATEEALYHGELDLLYIAPERLLNERTLQLLGRCQLSIFAIDEAHCVSQWGHDFRPEYQQLFQLSARFPHVPRIALTATADGMTRKEIVEQLQLNNADIYINSFDRPNIRYTIQEAHNARQQLLNFININHPNDAGIIYCLSRKKVESTAEWLSQKGRQALPYHAGMPANLRYQHQERFLREDSIIIVATIAFGMGIDKPDVRFVAHLNLPKSIEAYYQETGRAGRDGEPAHAWMAYGLQDVILLRQMTQDSSASEQHKRVVHHKLEAMLGLCELTTCRRQTVLNYFDEASDKPCGNCDNCLNPPETWDGLKAAQKALSCVFRTGQRFGVNYVIDVLLGKDNARITQFGHDTISTFGIGEEHTTTEWKSIFRQLISAGYLSVDIDGHGAIKLTEKSRPLLRGEQALQLRKEIKTKFSKSKGERETASSVRFVDAPLWEALRALRLRLAQEQGVPPYVIFHDTVLRQMVNQRPDNEESMTAISGIGEQKLLRYGQTFLEEIRQYPREPLLDNNLSDTVNETLQLYSQGKDTQAIAQERAITEQTIYKHYAEAIEIGLLDPLDVLPLVKDDIEYITQAWELLDLDDQTRLKPLYESLEGEYDYEILRCVIASF